MPIIQTAELRPGQLDFEQQHSVYNGLDACVTLEVFQELRRLRRDFPATYDFERALQGPYLDMMFRGFKVDVPSRAAASHELRLRIAALQGRLDALAAAVWDKGLNARSPLQIKEFFYKKMGLPEVWINQKGERKLSSNREALEKLEQYLYARPIVACILAIRDLSKQLEVLETAIDSDERFRTSYNIAGTETGRPSSSENAFGTGGNAQNIAPGLRFVFVADYGWKIGVIDLEQVEARDVGFVCGCLFDDWSYLDNCESGDLHTNNSKLVWPELAWSGDRAGDRKVAEQRYYRDFSYRDMSKRGGHLSNYMGTAWTASRVLKVDIKIMEDFQRRYCRGAEAAYPCIPKYWQWVAEGIQMGLPLKTLFGRERQFFGRPNDDSTVREGIAYVPQGSTGERMNLGLWRIWRYMPEVQLLGQGFDSVMFQFREGKDEAAIIGRALELVRVELKAPNGRSYVVPGEAKVGWNWGARHSDDKPIGPANRLNPDGLIKWSSSKPDLRQRSVGAKRIML